MSSNYKHSPIPIRADIEEAHQRVWEAMARPGTWWHGHERVAIAQATREALNCELCKNRKAALSPYAVDGDHDTATELPAVVVDVVHRVTTDPGRLTRPWFESLLADGLHETHYVEALAVAIRTISIDTFCRALGLSPHPLPTPIAGEPSRLRPAEAIPEGAWVPTIPNGQAAPSEQDLYGSHHAENVLRALSLVPDELRMTIHVLVPPQYMDAWRVPDPSFDPGRSISRAQMEFLAARVSALNGCFY